MRGTWVTESVTHLILDFSSGYHLRVLGLTLVSGSVLSMESVWDSLPLTFLLTLLLALK